MWNSLFLMWNSLFIMWCSLFFMWRSLFFMCKFPRPDIPIKYYMMIIIGCPFSLCIPSFFSLSIEQVNHTDVYYWTTTAFGFSKLFLFYSLLALVFESIIPTILLIAFNIVVLFKYKRRSKFIISLNIQSVDTIKKSENRFTKMIIIITGVYSITHFFDLLSSIANRVVSYTDFQFSDQTKSIVFSSRALAYLFLYLQFVFNLFIYVSIDPNLRKIFKELIHRVSFKIQF